MSENRQSNAASGFSGFQGPSEEPEQEGLLRLTKLVERLFRVPVAYMALLNADLGVSSRIGSGSRYWEDLRTFPAEGGVPEALLWSGSDYGEIRFAAAAPLRASDGLQLGALIIADVVARPEFHEQDLEVLSELAGVLAGKMELRLMAHLAREWESAIREAEARFRDIADAAPVMIVYSDAYGGSSFVNKTWLEFTGRSLPDELGEGFADNFHPEHRNRVLHEYCSAFRERKPLKVEFPLRRYDGEYQWVESRGTPRFLDNGNYAGYISCFTELGHAAQGD
jgi:PAS domain S-box-containing protein